MRCNRCLANIQVRKLACSLFSFAHGYNRTVKNSVPTFVLKLDKCVTGRIRAPRIVVNVHASVTLMPYKFVLLTFIVV